MRRIAVILVHADRQVRVHLDRRADQVAKNDVVGECPRTTAGLHNDRAVGLVRRLHDGQHLFHVVDVESRQAVAVLGGVIEQLA